MGVVSHPMGQQHQLNRFFSVRLAFRRVPLEAPRDPDRRRHGRGRGRRCCGGCGCGCHAMCGGTVVGIVVVVVVLAFQLLLLLLEIALGLVLALVDGEFDGRGELEVLFIDPAVPSIVDVFLGKSAMILDWW